ncbi:MAG: hypothetical protein KDA93_03975 [Planctomycetaceae bacterium]|nr:hypothetical protein [Planctomycetaceae bacterium]
MTRRAYTVVWDQDLSNDAADFWMGASQEIRSEFSRACDEIDMTLASAPDSVGRQWQGLPDQFIWSLPGYSFSIVAVYRINRGDRIVNVTRLHLSKT